MDGWMDGPSDCLPSVRRGQKAHNVVIALTKRKKKRIPFSFLSFFRLSRIACVGVLSVLSERACCHISEMGISGSFRLSLALQSGEERSFQSAKYSNRQTRDGNGIAKVEPRRVSERAREGERAGGAVVAAHAQFTVNGGCK